MQIRYICVYEASWIHSCSGGHAARARGRPGGERPGNPPTLPGPESAASLRHRLPGAQREAVGRGAGLGEQFTGNVTLQRFLHAVIHCQHPRCRSPFVCLRGNGSQEAQRRGAQRHGVPCWLCLSLGAEHVDLYCDAHAVPHVLGCRFYRKP